MSLNHQWPSPIFTRWPPSTTNIPPRCWKIEKIMIYWLLCAKKVLKSFPHWTALIVYFSTKQLWLVFGKYLYLFSERVCFSNLWYICVWQSICIYQVLVFAKYLYFYLFAKWGCFQSLICVNTFLTQRVVLFSLWATKT